MVIYEGERTSTVLEASLCDNVFFVRVLGEERKVTVILLFLLVLTSSEEELSENPPQRL